MNRRHQERPGKFLFTAATMMILAASTFLISARICRAADAVRMLLVPFTINAAGDLSYLQRGITDMLTSRLEHTNAVKVITADQGGDADLSALARKAGADFVITGSVTILGESVSTDAQVARAGAINEPVLSFGQAGSSQSDVIESINMLAADINSRVLKQSQGQSDAAPPPIPVPAGDFNRTQAVAPPPPAAENPRPASAGWDSGAPEPMRLAGIGTIEGQLNGLSAGDVDGDGREEIIAITNTHLMVYRFIAAKWVKFAEYDSAGDFIGVDAADVNRNGRQELFITQFSQMQGKVLSFVLEWDGKSLQTLATQLPWYFRALDDYRNGRILVGQPWRQGKRFTTGIYEMKWAAGAYSAGERLTLPKGLGVFGFARGAVRSPDKTDIVRYSSDDYVQILTPAGEEVWATTEHYGGGANFVVFTDEMQWDVQDYIYLSPRVHLYDVDRDGVQEMLVVKNQFSFTGGSVLGRQRFYAKGHLEWLKAHDAGIRSIAQTLDMSRFIADSALVDIDGDGNLEIVAAVVKKTRGITDKGSSYLSSFDINPAGVN